jgi:cytochrome c553
MTRLMLPTLLAASALLAFPALAADVAAGRVLAEDACADCHGDDGAGDDTYPPINGMTVEKFTTAMQEYRDKTRSKSPQMVKAAQKLTAAQIADLAAYYATLK